VPEPEIIDLKEVVRSRNSEVTQGTATGSSHFGCLGNAGGSQADEASVNAIVSERRFSLRSTSAGTRPVERIVLAVEAVLAEVGKPTQALVPGRLSGVALPHSVRRASRSTSDRSVSMFPSEVRTEPKRHQWRPDEGWASR
jgi:hypothetical protein